jgi:acetolactate synthase-1/2/3 large subunit
MTRTGADVVIESFRRHDVEYVFGLPGGAVMPIFDSILDSKIRLILTRHEQGATHMADGYARATGKPGVVLVTSGPGATNTVTGLLTAHMDSAPLVVVTGQQITPMLGKDAFQEADIFGITIPVVKHSYLVKHPDDLPRVMKEAFYLCNTGRPGPILVDIPKDVAAGDCHADFPERIEDCLPGYTIPGLCDRESVLQAAALLRDSRRPLLYVGQGARISHASGILKEFAEKLNAPVTTTLLGKGAFPETHVLSLGMLGMHGTAYANKAVVDCDLIFSIGGRWDDRITGKLEEFCPTARKIHLDIDPAEQGKVVQPDVSLIGDAATVLRELIKHVQPLDTAAWLEQIAAWKARYPLKFSRRGGLKAQYVLELLWEITEGNAVVTTDVGQHQMWCAQYYDFAKPRRWINSGGLGTMGFGLPSAIGAKVAQPDELVVCVAGDGSLVMTCQELATAVEHDVDVKVFIMNNGYLGMVRQWQELFWDKRYSSVDMGSSPDWVKLAEAFGARGMRVDQDADMEDAMREAIGHEGPVVLDVRVRKEENCYPMIPAGAAARDMVG